MNPLSRRELLRRCSLGFGGIALSGLLSSPAFGASSPNAKPGPKAKAKNVIFCYMSGGVSHVDSFDPKPALRRLHGQAMPVPIQRTVFNDNGKVMGSPWQSKHYGKSGLEMTNLFPRIADCADDLTIVRSMTSKVSEHAQGNYFFHTGFPFMGHPSAGAWLTYGLGSANQNLPGFVVLQSGGAVVPHGGVGLYSNGYLPGQHQASILKADGALALANIKPGEADAAQRRRLGFIQEVDQAFAETTREPQVEAAIRNYETAYRMQAAVPEVCDLNGETEATQQMYGLNSPDKLTASYARQALLARRLVERGVRFVELSCLSAGIGAGGAANPWDQHGAIAKGHGAMAHQVDQPIAALLKDLKQRGLLESTIVIFSGEFGRTPFSQGSDGRDHNPYGFSLWVAGGGFKAGTAFGATDELGYYAVDQPLTVYDFWATILHQLGLDHEKLTYRFGGRDFRLTDVHGNVIEPILA
ncbi:MAG: sulfatase [Opitutia bacterium AMD-G3]|nr:MAG: sulfatase [Opitutae bacterium AMD-G3]